MNRKKDLSAVIEDYALERIPMQDRKSWFDLFIIFVGFATVMFFLMAGSVTTTMAGFSWGLVALIVGAAAGLVSSVLIAPIALKEGLSCDLISRSFAFGQRGSALGSAVYAFYLLLFLAVESALILGAASYVLGLDPNALWVKLVFYVPMFALWAVLTLFGFDQLKWVARVFVPLMFVFLAYIFVTSLLPAGHLADAFSNPGLPGLPLDKGGIPQSVGFLMALNFTVGLAVMMGLFSCDYSRYGRRPRDLWPMYLAGNVGALLVIPILGAMVIFAAFPQMFQFFKSLGLPDSAAAEAAGSSAGMVFTVFGGWLGLCLVLFSQVKIQTMNLYGASLAIANFLAMGFNFRPGRGWAVVLGSIAAFVLVFTADTLQLVQVAMMYVGILLATWVTIVATDYYVVRRWLKLAAPGIRNLDALPAFNWPGVVTFVLTSVVGTYVFATGAVPVAVALPIPMALVLHTVFSVVTRGKYQAETGEREGGMAARPASALGS